MSITTEDYKKILESVIGKEKFQIFLASLTKDPIKGATFNDRKVLFETIKKDIPVVEESDFKNYFYYPYGTVVSHQPLYFTGAFYPMDCSAFAVCHQVAASLSSKKDLQIIDLCAAPGGKSIGLLNLVSNVKLLISNDITYKRAQVLKTNLERGGFANTVVTSNDPTSFLNSFSSTFSCVLLDVPCSGSGMTRKKDKMAEDWSFEKVKECVEIQENLLETSYKLAKKDGVICYSTCSYSVEEDEKQIEAFLKKHSDVQLLPMQDDGSLDGLNHIGKRYIPGLFNGEGQYCCLMKKVGGEGRELENIASDFLLENQTMKGITFLGSRRILPFCPKELLALTVLKLGYAVDDLSSYAKCPYDWDLSHCESLPFKKVELDSLHAGQFSQGQDIRMNTSSFEGQLVVVQYQKTPLGFGKGVKGRLRNFIPKGLRTN